MILCAIGSIGNEYLRTVVPLAHRAILLYGKLHVGETERGSSGKSHPWHGKRLVSSRQSESNFAYAIEMTYYACEAHPLGIIECGMSIY